MRPLKVFRTLQPYFFSGLLDDPVLLVTIRPTGRSLLFDCGQIHHLAKRVLRSLDAIFISHAHMDHFMGIDHVIRHIHVAPRTLQLFGPPGIATRFANKISGYDWNLSEETWCDILVTEVHAERLEETLFRGSQGFSGEAAGTRARTNPTIYTCRHLRVDADLCDHKIPSLAFRVTERPAFLISRETIRQKRLKPGAWIRELKRRFHHDDWTCTLLEVTREAGLPTLQVPADTVETFYREIRQDVAPASLGYISDVGFTPGNLARLERLLQGVTLLFSECTFLAEDLDKARLSAHLCTQDLNRLTHLLKPALLLPMHLSKAYIDRPTAVYNELDPPAGTTVLSLPVYRTPRPLLPEELDQAT